MTIEEAKIKIEELACYARTKGWDDEYTEAVNMAIKALEQQDKVLDAIKEIRDLFKQGAAYVPNYDAYGLCLSIICKHMEVEE